MKPICIAMAVNDAYAQHLGCALASILLHAEEDDAFFFYILSTDISNENKEKLGMLQKIRPFQIKFLVPDWKIIEDVKIPGTLWTKDTFSRLYLTELVPDRDRMIYIDVDTITTTSLRELWEFNLQGKSLGVVADRHNPPELAAALGINPPTFNAGVLLMDLGKMRRERSLLRCFDWLLEPEQKICLPDQDALNVVFQHDKIFLPCRWNMQLEGDKHPSVFSQDYYFQPEVKAAIKQAKGIFHYTGKQKPWLRTNNEAQRKYYWEALQQTPWKDYCAPPLSVKERIRLSLRRNRLNQKFKMFCKKIKKYWRGTQK